MAVATATKRVSLKPRNLPRPLRERAEVILAEDYSFMDSPIFKQRGIEKELFNFDVEPQLPMVGWYQPTREEIADQLKGTPQLMKAPEEKLMFLRFNFAKRKLVALQK